MSKLQNSKSLNESDSPLNTNEVFKKAQTRNMTLE